ncbi:MAG TPA: histidine kinase dimerization/phospho-acceptor domain-containing protein [Thermoanaerobaculia bacterium]|nr:histidine kinase dimerization/phospho-acceptor domain-containing protein [Thermoanaerobaculia bacterium]
MGASDNASTLPGAGEIAGLLGPGVVSLGAGGNVRFADPRALELLGCADGGELERLWETLGPQLETAGMSWNGAAAGVRWTALDLPAASSPAQGETGAARRLLFDLRHDPASGGVLLVQDLGTLTGLETDLRLISQMRSVAEISPAVAHDLRAPINAMVFNIEVLREMVSSGRAADPGSRDKLLRYADVLKEELQRLHRGLETFLAFISPRSDKFERLDLRELAEELAALLVAPARKQQVQVKPALPAEPLPAQGNRYLLRQALLHLALAALAETPRQGALHVDLERLGDRARLRVYGEADTSGPAAAGDSGAPGFDLRFSPAGALAQLWVARSIIAAHGGEARAAAPAAGLGGGVPQAYEVELMILSSETKEQ